MKKLASNINPALEFISELELLADDNDCILWVRNHEYNKQLYLSSSFQRLWGQETIELYRDPKAWSHLISARHANNDLYTEITQQRLLICPDYTAIFAVNHPRGEEVWFQDRSFRFNIDKSGKTIIAGCALYVSHKQQIENEQELLSNTIDSVITKFYQILINNLGHINPDDHPSSTLLNNLSRREKQMFTLFLQGKTIAQVAAEIHLSPRTIEGYLNSLKLKLACESKSDLIMKAIENSWLMLNIS